MSVDLREIEEAYNKDGPGSEAAVKRMAKNRGLNQKVALEWWRTNGRKKDVKKAKVFEQGRKFGNPIYSQRPGGWQFDTVIPKHGTKGNYMLWFTNVNTKETRAYEMPNKSSESVKEAMEKFLIDTKNNKKAPRPVYSLTSDEDQAYATEDLLQFYKDNGIKYRTTTKNSKHILGIVNRNIKMIRDRIANTNGLVDTNGTRGRTGNMTKEEVNKKLAGWNTQPNENLAGHSPKELTDRESRDLELDYIANKMNEADERREKAMKGIHEGQYVRRYKLGPKEHAEGNLDPYDWKIHHIDKLRGKVWLGRENEKEGLVQVPRYQIITGDEYQKGKKNPPKLDMLTKTPAKIIESKQGKYTVEMTDGSKQTMTQRQLRGNQPLNPLRIEEEFKPEEKITTRMVTRRRRLNLSEA